MITPDINRILSIIKKYGKENALPIEILREHMNRFYLGFDIDVNKILEICLKLKILESINDVILINGSGLELYNLIKIDNEGKKILDDSLESQKYYLIKLLKNSAIWNDEKIIKIFKEAEIDWTKIELRNKIDVDKIITLSDSIRELILELNLIKFENNSFFINNEISDIISKLRSGNPVTEQEFEETEEVKKMVGKTAEKECVKFEKNRLEKIGEEWLVKGIIRISQFDERLGYDVVSYTGNNKDLNYDKFIEVKGTKGSKPIFFWSENEIKVAKEKGDNYYIQLWCKVGSEDIFLFKEIKNPHEKFFKNELKNVKITQSVVYNIELSEKI